MTALRYGAKDWRGTRAILVQAVGVALLLAVVLLALSGPFCRFSVWVMGGSDGIQELAAEYVGVRVWAFPASLTLMALHGWFLGMQDAKTPLVISVVTNVVNIACSALFALKMDMGISGIALGTVVAQWVSLGVAIVIYLCKYNDERCSLSALRRGSYGNFFAVNRDVFIRSFFVCAAYTLFTRESANIDDVTLATNTLLMQLFTLYSYLFDGVAFAGESLSGRYVGARDMSSFRSMAKALFLWGGVLSLAYTIVYVFGWEDILLLLGGESEVLRCAGENIIYILVLPLIGFVPFLIDGIYIGMARIRPLRNSVFVAFVVFGIMLLALEGNDALWWAFLTFTFLRGALLLFDFRKFIRC